MESILRNVFIATPWLMLGSAKVRVSTHDYRGTFMYKQRQCYQDKSHCIDEQNDCCLSSYDPDETYCSNGTEIVFEGLDCNDGSHDGDHDGTFSYQSDAGSYFCCETIESDYVDESKCHDFATDCCAPPYFESGNATKYLYADCAYPWTLRWLYGEAGQCGHDSKIGKYECVYTSSTSTTTRNSKSDYLGTFIYEGRQCYQDKDHCIDTENDCCIGSYDNTYGNNLTRYCKGNTEVVFQGADCFDGKDLSTFKEDGGSYFCCEPVGDYTHHEDKCRDGGNDCCAPPPFGINDGTGEGSNEYEYLMAHCADGYTIQWLYEKTERCSYYTGAYECYSTTTTSSTTRSLRKSPFLYQGRNCYQTRGKDLTGPNGYCTDSYNDCCSSDPYTAKCRDDYEVVWDGMDCPSATDEYIMNTFKENGASFFCCEPIRGDYTEDPEKCSDKDCCAPPYFVDTHKDNATTFQDAKCNGGYTLQWLYGEENECAKSGSPPAKGWEHSPTGKYTCCSTTTSTRSLKKSPFQHLGRKCYQTSGYDGQGPNGYCTDENHDCCVSFPAGASCRDDYEVVWEGEGCQDSTEVKYTFDKNGGSFFCCEPIRGDCSEDKTKCSAKDCCAPPSFIEEKPLTAFVDATCSHGYTLQWLNGDTSECATPANTPAHGVKDVPAGLYKCCSTTTTSTTSSPAVLFRNKTYGHVHCETVLDYNRTLDRCGVPVDFDDAPTKVNFLKSCTDATDATVVELCREACTEEDGCEFYAVTKNKDLGCNCTLKSSSGLKNSVRVTKFAEWAVYQQLWFCDSEKFDDFRFVDKFDYCHTVEICVYEMPEGLGGTWAMNESNWTEVDKFATSRCGEQLPAFTGKN